MMLVIVGVVVRVSMVMVVGMPVIVRMLMRMVMSVLRPVLMSVAVRQTEAMGLLMADLAPVDEDRGLAASANRAHHCTSMSLIRISSPPCGSSRPPPHRGQGSSLSAISTVSPQS